MSRRRWSITFQLTPNAKEILSIKAFQNFSSCQNFISVVIDVLHTRLPIKWDRRKLILPETIPNSNDKNWCKYESKVNTVYIMNSLKCRNVMAA